MVSFLRVSLSLSVIYENKIVLFDVGYIGSSRLVEHEHQ